MRPIVVTLDNRGQVVSSEYADLASIVNENVTSLEDFLNDPADYEFSFEVDENAAI